MNISHCLNGLQSDDVRTQEMTIEELIDAARDQTLDENLATCGIEQDQCLDAKRLFLSEVPRYGSLGSCKERYIDALWRWGCWRWPWP